MSIREVMDSVVAFVATLRPHVLGSNPCSAVCLGLILLFVFPFFLAWILVKKINSLDRDRPCDHLIK
jgi:hypothetical protein